MTLCDLNNMDVTGDGEVSELEFLTYMLVALQKVDREDIDDIKKAFRKLDGTKTGLACLGNLFFGGLVMKVLDEDGDLNLFVLLLVLIGNNRCLLSWMGDLLVGPLIGILLGSIDSRYSVERKIRCGKMGLRMRMRIFIRIRMRMRIFICI